MLRRQSCPQASSLPSDAKVTSGPSPGYPKEESNCIIILVRRGRLVGVARRLLLPVVERLSARLKE
eukprot:2866045-Pleurochrysis_carterae.AAC.1